MQYSVKFSYTARTLSFITLNINPLGRNAKYCILLIIKRFKVVNSH